jgi:hypothetical protein
VSDHDRLVIEMIVMEWVRLIRVSAAGEPTAVDVARARRKASFLADQRGSIAFETPIVYLFMLMTLLLPLSDLAIFGFKYISAWEALRAFGQYVQYNQPLDITSTSSWSSTLPATVAGYPINNVQVLCGNTSAGAACTSSNVATSPAKYYSYNTTVTVTPMVLKSVLCTSGNTNPCSFTLNYSERFQ